MAQWLKCGCARWLFFPMLYNKGRGLYGNYAKGGAFASTYGAYRSRANYGGSNSNTNMSSNLLSIKTNYPKKRKFKGKKGYIKDVVRNMEPAKHFVVNDTAALLFGAGFTHNTIYSLDVTAGVIQGTGLGQRIGDFAHLEALKVNGYYASPTATNQPVQYRTLVLLSTVTGIPAGPGFGSILGASDIFFVGTGSTQQTAAIVNPRACIVLDDRQFVINDLVVGTSQFVQYEYTVQIKRQQDYREVSGRLFGKKYNLYVVTIASINLGTTGTTQTGVVSMNLDLIFKDM